jgi:hypothetical protein
VACRFHRMQKHKFGVKWPVCFLWNPYRSHPSMKNSVPTICAAGAPECTMCPADLTVCKNTNLMQHVPARLLLNPYRSHPRIKNSASTFHAPDTAECTTRPVDPTGCKNTTSAQRDRCAFGGNRTSRTRE